MSAIGADVLAMRNGQQTRVASGGVDPSTVRGRWMSVGSSDHHDPRTAGTEAAAAAITGPDPTLLVVFCSGRLDPAEVLAGIGTVAAGVPLIGCSSDSEITSAGPGEGRVVVTALGGSGLAARTAFGTGSSGGQRAAGAAAAACVEPVADLPHTALLLLTDGLVGDQEEIVSGAYEVVGAGVPLVGGAASPHPAAKQTFLLHGDQVLTDAVVGASIASASPLGIGVRHGWRKVGEPMLVTRCAKGRVVELDEKPALPTYLERLSAPAIAYTDPVEFDRFAGTRPIGVRRRSGEEVRNVRTTELFLSDGWLSCTGDIPEGGLVWIMEGDESTVLEAAGDACRAAVDALDGHQPVGLLAFDCGSRRGVLGEDGSRTEVSRMTGQAGGAPLSGFYSWGEIARTQGINGFHHNTVVILAVS